MFLIIAHLKENTVIWTTEDVFYKENQRNIPEVNKRAEEYIRNKWRDDYVVVHSVVFLEIPNEYPLYC